VKRQLKVIRVGVNESQYRVRIEDNDPTSRHLAPGVVRIRFLRELADNPLLLDCGPLPFQKMTVRQDGGVWVAELEATGS